MEKFIRPQKSAIKFGWRKAYDTYLQNPPKIAIFYGSERAKNPNNSQPMADAIHGRALQESPAITCLKRYLLVTEIFPFHTKEYAPMDGIYQALMNGKKLQKL